MPSNDLEIACTPERDLPATVAEEIRQLQQEAFAATAEFVRQRWWHTPLSEDELWFTARRSGRLIASVRVVRRVIRCGGREWTVAGVANVCSHPAHRGAGAAAACMRAVGRRIAQGGEFDFGLLFCGPKVKAFYEKLGWREIDNDMVFVDFATGRPRRSDPNSPGSAMISPGRCDLDKWPQGEMNINGCDW